MLVKGKMHGKMIHAGAFAVLAAAVLTLAAPVAAQDMPLEILRKGQSVKKGLQATAPLLPCILPVVLVGTGTCKATLSASEPGTGEMVALAAAGACSGPYTVFDSNAAAADHSITVQVAVEEFGVVLLGGSLLAGADTFPRSLTFAVSF